MDMKGICPSCEEERELTFVRNIENIEVRGEPIDVEMEYYKCMTCGEEFEDPHSDYDPLDKAYREYRRRHGLTQPEGIKSFRKKYGLAQHEMSNLLGWGYATLSRYENGALQNEGHEKTSCCKFFRDELLYLKNIKNSGGKIMASIEITLRDDQGEIINEGEKRIYKLNLGKKRFSELRFNEIERSVEEFKKNALPDITADLLKEVQSEYTNEITKKKRD